MNSSDLFKADDCDAILAIHAIHNSGLTKQNSSTMTSFQQVLDEADRSKVAIQALGDESPAFGSGVQQELSCSASPDHCR